jgi:nucleoside-triphosphatase THEP1
MSGINLLTGEIGSGKTSFCLSLAGIAREAGVDLGGLLSPAVFSEGKKTGIDVLDLKSSRQKRLAELKQVRSSEVETRRWAFTPQVVAWGNRKLLEAVPCDLLLIDELGPLEFLQGQGWANGFKVLAGGQYRAALVVIRPSLLENAAERWPGARVVDLSAPGPPPAPAELLQLLLAE